MRGILRVLKTCGGGGGCTAVVARLEFSVES